LYFRSLFDAKNKNFFFLENLSDKFNFFLKAFIKVLELALLFFIWLTWTVNNSLNSVKGMMAQTIMEKLLVYCPPPLIIHLLSVQYMYTMVMGLTVSVILPFSAVNFGAELEKQVMGK